MSRHVKPTTRVVEEHYFHSGNSGFTFRILTKTFRYSDDNVNAYYRAETSHGAHGEYSTASFPLGSTDMLDQIIEALQRARADMERNKNFHLHGARDLYHHTFDDRRANVPQIMNGYVVKKRYSPEIIQSEYSTVTRFLGHELRNQETDELVSFIPVAELGDTGLDEEAGSTYAASSTPLYRKEDIGKPVSIVRVMEKLRSIPSSKDPLP